MYKLIACWSAPKPEDREAFEAHATVVGCEMVEIDSGFLEFRYRVRCQFTSPEHGMIILLLLFEDSTTTGNMEP